jgi:hypothetical protein
MTNTVFFTASIIAIVYFLIKFLEMKYVLKEDKPLKLLVRDTIMVYFSIIIGDYIVNQFNTEKIQSGSPDVFVGNPEF